MAAIVPPPAATMASMLRAVCLDLMDTLLHDPYLDALEAATGKDVAALRPGADPDLWPQFEVAAISETEFVDRFFAPPPAGRPLDLEAFHRVRRDGYRFLPGMAELVDELGGRVARYVASNYPIWIEELRARFALDDRFEGVWASHHLGVRKPDQRFYERLLEAIDQRPSQCLFVDDRVANCEAAEAVGMRAHVFTGARDLSARLRKEGVLTAI